jgi:hypothetical protein
VNLVIEMPTWANLALVFGAWVLFVVWGLVQLAVENARLPEEQRRGFSFLPGFPIMPLAFWGLASIIDMVVEPWGTQIIGALHGVVAVILVGLIVRECWRLRTLTKTSSKVTDEATIRESP